MRGQQAEQALLKVLRKALHIGQGVFTEEGEQMLSGAQSVCLEEAVEVRSWFGG